jgi:hypothetical protein
MPGLPAVASACFTARVPVSTDARLVAVAPATPYSEHMSEMPISEASGHLDEVADRAL